MSSQRPRVCFEGGGATPFSSSLNSAPMFLRVSPRVLAVHPGPALCDPNVRLRLTGRCPHGEGDGATEKLTQWPGFLRPCACSRVSGPAEPGSACRRRTHVQAPGALRPWLPPAVLLSVVCAWRSANSHGSCFLPCEPCLRLRQKPSWE